jgi:transcriptional regulator with XRE-family HTH domain
MTTTTLSRSLAAEIRAELGRQGLSVSELARRTEFPQRWLARRLGRDADQEITVDVLAEMAEALDVSAEGLFADALRGCRDSNPRPSDLCPVVPLWPFGFVNTGLTVNRLAA